MSKAKSAFFCQNCGHEAAQWLGKCPGCKEWNTFIEERTEKTPKHVVSFSKSSEAHQAVRIQEVKKSEESRITLKDFELNRVLGGGIVPGSINLLGGDPGIGKSTLLLQLAIKEQLKVLYVSGEESEQQIGMRAERLGLDNPNCYLLTETNLQQVLIQAEQIQPQLLIIDSIKTPTGEVLDALVWETDEVIYLVKIKKVQPKVKPEVADDFEDDFDKPHDLKDDELDDDDEEEELSDDEPSDEDDED